MSPNTLRVHRSTCSLNQWVRSLVGLFTSAGTGEYFSPLQFTCRNCGGGDSRHLSSLRGSFSELKSHCHQYGALTTNATMNFVGLVLTTSDRWH
ncbi:hypothetical protein TNCV_1732331 [Trichonephila clavipes]|nr:hypothetical protein TNCV_1732331 [Trichonephila clavipes]